mmetsp:Transcript_510/g.1637  ORF Transcript_510/g.1637 Transcript_510/m.1637 type:complete len:215 (-) Transcript_510:442-1086(-)
MPSITLPKTTCFPSSHGVSAVHRKNCEPLVPGPALAMERMPSPSCLSTKFSSSNFSPKMLFPPVPFWFVKSPPWHMKPGITRWNGEPLYPNPFSIVHSARKFSAVLGVTSPRISMTIFPAASPPMSMSKKHLNLSLCFTSMRSMDITSMSKFNVCPASGWLQSRTTSSSVTSVMVACMPWPTMSLLPTTAYSSPTALTTSAFGTFILLASSRSP